ncbi:MAG TPA: hypothetical protein VHM30_17705 [Gemmatimonadaceae bacterium]|nr:hypothetical protein [Gemmatimonadaceae bacterium]
MAIDRNEAGVARAEHAPANNNAQGWGAAAFIVALALFCTFSAYYIHQRTFRSPNDPSAPATTLEHEPHA